jgi:hypothetical protein
VPRRVADGRPRRHERLRGAVPRRGGLHRDLGMAGHRRLPSGAGAPSCAARGPGALAGARHGLAQPAPARLGRRVLAHRRRGGDSGRRARPLRHGMERRHARPRGVAGRRRDAEAEAAASTLGTDPDRFRDVRIRLAEVDGQHATAIAEAIHYERRDARFLWVFAGSELVPVADREVLALLEARPRPSCRVADRSVPCAGSSSGPRAGSAVEATRRCHHS